MRDRIRKKIKISLIVIISIIIITYAYFEAGSLLHGPSIEINYPTSGLSINENTVNISGKTKNVSHFFLNGRPIFVSSNGDFSEKVILSKGYNSIFMEVEDRLGKKVQKLLEYVSTNKLPNATSSEKIAKGNSDVLGI